MAIFRYQRSSTAYSLSVSLCQLSLYWSHFSSHHEHWQAFFINMYYILPLITVDLNDKFCYYQLPILPSCRPNFITRALSSIWLNLCLQLLIGWCQTSATLPLFGLTLFSSRCCRLLRWPRWWLQSGLSRFCNYSVDICNQTDQAHVTTPLMTLIRGLFRRVAKPAVDNWAARPG